MPPVLRSFLVSLVRLLGLLALALVLLLLSVQHSMIYHPRPYQGTELRQNSQIADLPYATSQGAQHCYYVPPAAASREKNPARVWVAFSGNGSRALDWLLFLRSYPAPQDGFLLVDYPGYGACAGSASPETIRESADAALAALAGHLGTTVPALESRLGVLGHSLGAASALAFASGHPASRIVLLAPFTSLRDMARRTVGWPLCYLLRGNFDNRERLQEITRHSPAPQINIFFGTEDEVIPFTMGQELARRFSQLHFEPVEATGHNTILTNAKQRIHQVMTAP